MDVIVPYGIKYKKCVKKSFSEFKRTQLFPYLQKNLLDKNKETSLALMAEIHCSNFLDELHNFSINFFSNYLILSNLTFAFFLNQHLKKINNIKKTIPKSLQHTSLINSNEVRNIYCSIFCQFLDNIHHKFSIKIENKCHSHEITLLHSNLNSHKIIHDQNYNQLSSNLSKGISELTYWIYINKDNMTNQLKKFINIENIEKILYWIHWCYKIEKLEKRNNKNIIISFQSKFPFLPQNCKSYFEFYLWNKIWIECEKNNFLNKNLLKAYTSLFFFNYTHTKLKDRAGLLAISLLLCNSPLKINIERSISKTEIFTTINANIFYKNIQLDPDNDEKYLELYNQYHKLDNKISSKKIDKEHKMDLFSNFVPQICDEKKKVTEYFSPQS